MTFETFGLLTPHCNFCRESSPPYYGCLLLFDDQTRFNTMRSLLAADVQSWALTNKALGLCAITSVCVVLYNIGLTIYRLVFSNLSNFPGPKIAAASYWYEFYYDWLCCGKYIFLIDEMHKKYGSYLRGTTGTLICSRLTVKGPIVRINPNELSISDPEAYNDIYVSESRRRSENYHSFIKGIDLEGTAINYISTNTTILIMADSHLLTTGHDLHRRRRKPLEPFFSRLGVSRHWPILAEIVERFVARFESLQGTGSVIRLDHACSAFSGDVISQLCWNSEEKFLDDPNFAPELVCLI